MLIFDLPWILVLLPLPLLLQYLAPAHKESQRALQAPFFDDLVKLTGQTPGKGAIIVRPPWVQGVVKWVGWLLLVTALARPQWLGDPIVNIESARDLLLAVDLSRSMEVQDFTDEQGNRIDRLEAVKRVLDDFMTRREGDRLGLILFGAAPFLQVPFTQDHKTCRTLLNEAQIGMAGPQTMLGDTIGLAIKLFENSTQENRVLILLTDGNDTGSKVPPYQAARIAVEQGITIHTIAIGDPTTAGEEALDTEALQEIAKTTGGSFFHANDGQELEAIYRQLDELEPLEFESISYRPKTPLFHWPLAVFALLVLSYQLSMALTSYKRSVTIHHG